MSIVAAAIGFFAFCFSHFCLFLAVAILLIVVGTGLLLRRCRRCWIRPIPLLLTVGQILCWKLWRMLKEAMARVRHHVLSSSLIQWFLGLAQIPPFSASELVQLPATLPTAYVLQEVMDFEEYFDPDLRRWCLRRRIVPLPLTL